MKKEKKGQRPNGRRPYTIIVTQIYLYVTSNINTVQLWQD